MTLMEELDRRVEEGWIQRKAGPDGLRIYCYTAATTWNHHWDDYTRMARGLILDAEGNVVARPFPKFFNLGEPSCPDLPRLPYSVWEKMDGSLGIFFWHEGEWRVSTKGSFANLYTEYASEFIWSLSCFPKNVTVLTEIVLEKDTMARVVSHSPGIYFLGAVERDTGMDLPPDVWVKRWIGPSAQMKDIAIDDAISRTKDLEGTEGWVVRYADGTRIKIKTAWYLRLFRAISDLNVESIRRLLLSGQGLASFPEELRSEAEGIANSLLIAAREKEIAVRRIYGQMYHCDRKTFAMRVKDLPDAPLLFRLHSGKEISDKVLETV